VNTLNWTGNLGQLVRATITLPAQTVGAGNHVIKFYTSNPNGATDAVPANDAVTVNFNMISNGGSASLNEGFESQKQAVSGIFQTDWRAPAGWRTTGTDSSYFWNLDTITGGAYGQSATCLQFNNAGLYPGQPAPFNAVKRSALVTPEYDFSNAAAPMLTYDYAYSPIMNGSAMLTDTLGIKYSDDCGATWTYLLRKGGVALNTGTTTWGSKVNGSFFGPTSSQWKTENISLSVLAGKPEVIFAFENRSGNGNFMYLDNLKLTGATGIEDQQGQNEISVYPNPTNGNFTMELTAGNGEFQIFNVLGEKVLESQVTGLRSEVDLGNNPSGVYFIVVKTGEGSVTKKIVKE